MNNGEVYNGSSLVGSAFASKIFGWICPWTFCGGFKNQCLERLVLESLGYMHAAICCCISYYFWDEISLLKLIVLPLNRSPKKKKKERKETNYLYSWKESLKCIKAVKASSYSVVSFLGCKIMSCWQLPFFDCGFSNCNAFHFVQVMWFWKIWIWRRRH